MTCRPSGPLLKISDPAAIEKPGAISIDARLSVFEPPRPRRAAALAHQPRRPAGWPRPFIGPGKGPLFRRRHASPLRHQAVRRADGVNDAAFSIAGLVRSPVSSPAPPNRSSNPTRPSGTSRPTYRRPTRPGIRADFLAAAGTAKGAVFRICYAFRGGSLRRRRGGQNDAGRARAPSPWSKTVSSSDWHLCWPRWPPPEPLSRNAPRRAPARRRFHNQGGRVRRRRDTARRIGNGAASQTRR